MNKETMINLVKKLSGKQKLLTVGIIALLTIGALGAMGEFSGKKNGILSNVVEKVGLKKKETVEAIPVQTGTPQLSKENIYAGSRLLATEDYGIAPNNPQAENEQSKTDNQTTAQETQPKAEKVKSKK